MSFSEYEGKHKEIEQQVEMGSKAKDLSERINKILINRYPLTNEGVVNNVIAEGDLQKVEDFITAAESDYEQNIKPLFNGDSDKEEAFLRRLGWKGMGFTLSSGKPAAEVLTEEEYTQLAKEYREKFFFKWQEIWQSESLELPEAA